MVLRKSLPEILLGSALFQLKAHGETLTDFNGALFFSPTSLQNTQLGYTRK